MEKVKKLEGIGESWEKAVRHKIIWCVMSLSLTDMWLPFI